ncbi:MAG: UPF0280 family protein [Candidatus Marinimicrobia bacterium]|nr:UPF0280 family protein [Candidatus Neomarinimicrobiota bacterium]
MYEPRTYRQKMGGRFDSFTYRFRETDIWVGYDKESGTCSETVRDFIDRQCRALRAAVEAYLAGHPEFGASRVPLDCAQDAPEMIKELAACSRKADVGPMAGIAGAFSAYLGKACSRHFGFNEIVIENGGDDYLQFRSPVRVALSAGASPLSGKIHLEVPPEYSPLGLCASSGTFGHSFSYGKADLVSVACRNPILADMYATAFANRVQGKGDIEKVLDEASALAEILHVAVIKDDTVGIRGKFKIIS